MQFEEIDVNRNLLFVYNLQYSPSGSAMAADVHSSKKNSRSCLKLMIDLGELDISLVGNSRRIYTLTI